VAKSYAIRLENGEVVLVSMGTRVEHVMDRKSLILNSPSSSKGEAGIEVSQKLDQPVPLEPDDASNDEALE
jgi:hypothetical protein